MAVQARAPTVGVNDTRIGNDPWNNPGNALTSDNLYATVSAISANPISNYLKTKGFGFTLPANAVVKGIVLDVECKASGAGVTDYSVVLIKEDITFSANRALAGDWPIVDTWRAHGSSTDLWALTWTAADINSANFSAGVSISRATGRETAYVDYVQVTVYYIIPVYAAALVSGAGTVAATAKLAWRVSALVSGLASVLATLVRRTPSRALVEVATLPGVSESTVSGTVHVHAAPGVAEPVLSSVACVDTAPGVVEWR